MRSLKTLMSIIAMAAAAAVPSSAVESAFRIPRARKSKRYPEQSSRQAMRGYRRAQGGPGISLVPGINAYAANS